MKFFTHIFLVLASLGLLSSCGGQKTHQPPVANTSIAPRDYYNKEMSLPSYEKIPGQWTVEDVLQDYGSYAERKLAPYFSKAKVSYPPKELVLLALKEEKKLEVWAKSEGEEYRFIRDYDIRAASGVAGPKLRQGDRQVPEGVYRIVSLNPNSHYHLSMKLNYPNEFDLYHAEQEGRFDPGSDIFIHGKAASIGCLAMGDEAIEEIFVLAAQVGKENIKVVIAPRDPRVAPLDTTELDGPPEWAPELYDMISSEIGSLSPKVSVSSNSNAQSNRAQ